MTNLEAFVAAQDAGGTFAAALEELSAGTKRTHWMWFVFPQLAGLGHSERASRFGLEGLGAARALLAHPVLGPRLRQATDCVLAQPVGSAEAVLGSLDAMKLRSSMTLFHLAAPGEVRFQRVLDRFFEGVGDRLTEELLDAGPGS